MHNKSVYQKACGPPEGRETPRSVVFGIAVNERMEKELERESIRKLNIEICLQAIKKLLDDLNSAPRRRTAIFL